LREEILDENIKLDPTAFAERASSLPSWV